MIFETNVLFPFPKDKRLQCLWENESRFPSGSSCILKHKIEKCYLDLKKKQITLIDLTYAEKLSFLYGSLRRKNNKTQKVKGRMVRFYIYQAQQIVPAYSTVGSSIKGNQQMH